METEELDTFFATLVASGFKHCTRIPTTGNAAKILSTTSPDGRPIVLKIFQDRPEDGVKARDLFELELFAHESLKSTGRVADVMFSWHGNEGQYFIVKPFYEKFLDSERRMLSPLELLEIAAQEVDISEKFFARGWRDLDGRYSNDAVDEKGRVVRVDLDGAYVSWGISSKFVPEHHTVRDQENCSALFIANRKVFSQHLEIRSLIIRISRLLLRNDEVPWDLLNEVLTLNDHTPSSFMHAIKNLGKSARQLMRQQSAIRVRQKWVSAWEEGLSRGAPLQGALTRVEAKFLALLFFHILTHNDNEFTFSDLYQSLMIVTLNSLQVEARTLSENSNSKQTEQFMNLVEGLYEVTRLREALRNIQEEVAAESVSTSQATIKAAIPLHLAESKYSGNFWPAITKGPEWKSQDIVLPPSEGRFPTFLLADGATGAAGEKAISVVQHVYNEWVQNVHARTLNEGKGELCDLIRSIHDRLTQIRQRDGGKIETAVAVVGVFSMPPGPAVLLIRYGDVGYLVTYESADGKLQGVLGTKTEESPPPPLGSRENWKLEPFEELQVLQLQWEGIYRIRAFSDGVGTEQQAWDLLGGDSSIQALVDQAREWTKYPQVGGDDWSIAGLDLTVQRATTGVVEEIIPEPLSRPTSTLKSLEQIDATNFSLSKGALRFWTRTIAPLDGPSRQFQSILIRNILRSAPSLVEEKAAAVTTDNASYDYSYLLRYAFYGLLILALGWLVWVGGRWLLRNDRETAVGPTTVAVPTPSAQPQLINEQQQELYARLKADQIYVLQGLPSGSVIDEPKFKRFISDLAQVLRQTDWNVIIEIHTDTTGTPDKNKATSASRRDKIKTQLTKDEGIAQTRFEAVAMGESRTLVSGATEQSNLINRRLEIYKRRL